MSATATVSRPIFERGVARIVDPAPALAGAPGHTARRLIDSGDPGFTDPFLLMAEDWMPHGAFAVHPHRGIETVAFVIEGTVEHYSRRHQVGRRAVDDGRARRSSRRNRSAHTLQLWVNLPTALKMTAPRYQDLLVGQMPTFVNDGVKVKIFSGKFENVSANTLNHVPILMQSGNELPQWTLDSSCDQFEDRFAAGSIAIERIFSPTG